MLTGACYYFMATLGPPEHMWEPETGMPCCSQPKVILLGCLSMTPGTHREGGAWWPLSSNWLKVHDGHPEPGFGRRADLGETHVRPKAGSEVSRPCLETLGCVGLQLPPPCVLNTY